MFDDDFRYPHLDETDDPDFERKLRINEAEYRAKLDLELAEERKVSAFRYQNRLNFDIQDNNAADPEQAGWDEHDN